MLISVNQKEKPEIAAIARIFHECGFKILSTGRTCELLNAAGIPAEHVNKQYEGRPNITDMMTNGKVQLIINSPVGKESIHDDSYLRRNAIRQGIPYITTIAAARAAAEGIRYMKTHETKPIRSLQEWHGLIR